MSNLGGFSEEALQLFQLAASEQHYNFSEEGEVYDFTRCMRADGSFYGTRGSCKKGSTAGAKEKAEPKTKAPRLPKPEAGFDMEGAKAKRRDLAGQIVQAALKGDHAKREKLQKEALDLDKKITANGGRMEERTANQRNLREAAQNARQGRRDEAKEKLKARKPRATTAETKPVWQEAEKKVKEAKAAFKAANAETKGDKSPEARKRRLEAGRALDRAEREAERAAARYDAARKRESYAKMTPEQKKEEREWRKTQKMYG